MRNSWCTLSRFLISLYPAHPDPITTTFSRSLGIEAVVRDAKNCLNEVEKVLDFIGSADGKRVSVFCRPRLGIFIFIFINTDLRTTIVSIFIWSCGDLYLHERLTTCKLVDLGVEDRFSPHDAETPIFKTASIITLK